MGLDTYASRGPELGLTDEDVEAFRGADVVLCECHGDTSFRGKLYVGVVSDVTGVALAEGWIPPEVVRRMAAALETCDPVEAARTETQVSAGDVVELGRFLRLCADRGLGLVSS